MAMKPIEILINAKDNASGVFSSLQSKVAAVGAAIAAYFGINAFAGVVQGAADFEQGMSRVKAATGATAEEMQALTKAAEDAGANTKYTSTEAAGALENLAKAGLSANDSIAALPAVLNLAQAGDIGLAEASETVTKAVMGMGLAFTDAARVADVLALGANATNTSVSGLAQALSYAAPVAQSAGVSLEGTVAIMGKLADAGIDASRSGTAVSNMLAQFSDPASAFKMALADAGITTNNFEQALHQLAAAGPAGEKAILAVGLNAGPALRALLNQGMGALDELKGKLEGAAGSAAATAAVMQNNLHGALNGLASAWDTVKNALGTPVLPVLQQGVEQLAGAFRAAVADGTVQKFGESIATAFQHGIKFVRDFIGTIDFTAVLARLQDFADRSNEFFAQVGTYATNAGNTVKLSYGVMSAGANAVLTAIYGLGIAFAETAAGIVGVAANVSEALSKIAIGDAKDRLIAEAAQMREVLAGLAGVSEEFGKKAVSAMEDTARGAEIARSGWAGVTSSAQAATPAMDAAAKAAATVAKELASGADAAAKAGAAYQKKVNDEQIAKQAADDHAAALVRLRGEYAQLVAGGSIQAAAEKLQEINKALRGTPPAAADATKAAQDAAAQIDAAFQRLGISSAAALKNQAANAQRDFDVIKNAGTSTAEDISAAFRVAAEKAIAANKGIAPSWVTAQAGVRGFRIEVDDTGKSVVKSMDEAKKATEAVGHAAAGSVGGFRAMGQSAEQAAAQLKKLNDLYDKHRLDKNKDTDRIGKSGDYREVQVMQTDINQEIARRYGEEFVGNKDAQEAYNLRLQLENYQRNYGNARSKQSWDQQRNIAAELDRVERLIADERTGKTSTTTTTTTAPTQNTTTATTSRSTSGGMQTGAPSTVVNLNYNGAAIGSINTDAQGAKALQDFMTQLQAGRSTAGR